MTEKLAHDIGLKAIEKHLVKLYIEYLNDIFSAGIRPKNEFENFALRPLYLAAMEYCKGNKIEAKDVLGVARATLDVKLDKYFATRDVSKIKLIGAEKRLFMLYSSYLEQILADGISDKFSKIVDRAMYRSVMIYAEDDLSEGCILLGMSWSTLDTKLYKLFGTKKLYALNKSKEVGWP